MSGHSQLPGASRIRKGLLDVLVLSEDDVVGALDGRELLAALAEGFAATARGEVQSPPRPEITVPGKGFLLSMPAWHTGGLIGVKQVSVFDGNLELGLPNHLALITLYEPETGKPVCVMDGTHITGARTAGAAVVSADLLARPDARTATIVGAGVQGREHLSLLPLVRELETIRIASLHLEDARSSGSRPSARTSASRSPSAPRRRPPTTPRLSAAIAVALCMLQMSCRPELSPSRP